MMLISFQVLVLIFLEKTIASLLIFPFNCELFKTFLFSHLYIILSFSS